MKSQAYLLGLTDAAAQTLSVIAPYVSRLVRPIVHLDDQAETASTDGLFTSIPMSLASSNTWPSCRRLTPRLRRS